MRNVYFILSIISILILLSHPATSKVNTPKTNTPIANQTPKKLAQKELAQKELAQKELAQKELAPINLPLLNQAPPVEKLNQAPPVEKLNQASPVENPDTPKTTPITDPKKDPETAPKKDLKTDPEMDNEFTFDAYPKTSKDIVVAGSMIPHIFHPTEPGAYNEILKLLTDNTENIVHLKFQPIRRAQLDFLQHRSDCYFISDLNLNNSLTINYDLDMPDDKLIFSHVVNQTHIKVYTLAEHPAIKSLSGLAGLVVGADPGTGLGYALKEKLPPSAHILPTESVEKSIDLLKRGRISAIVAYDIDIKAHYRRTKADYRLHAAKGFNIHTSNDCVACWKNKKTQGFVNQFNKQLDTLKNSGKLAALLDE